MITNFEKTITAKEAEIFKQNTPLYSKQIDKCHIFARSSHPELKYNNKNIVSLSRTIHKRMDDIQNPLTGKKIGLNEHYYWWWRISNLIICDYDEKLDYRKMVLSQINEKAPGGIPPGAERP